VKNLPGKSKRKVLKQGSSTVVSIPADYRRYHNLEPGKEVTVLYDNLLLIIPKDQEKKILEDPEKRDLIKKILEK